MKQRKTYSLSDEALELLELVRQHHNRSASNQLEQLIQEEAKKIKGLRAHEVPVHR